MRNGFRIYRAEMSRAVGKDSFRSIAVFVVVGIIVGNYLWIVGYILKVCQYIMRQIVSR